MDLCWQCNVSAFNMLSRLVTAFLPRCQRLLVSWLQKPSAVILEPKKIKSVTFSIVSPSICYEMMGLDAMIFVFWMLRFFVVVCLFECWFLSQLFHSPVLPSPRGSLVPLHFLPLGWYHRHTWGCCYFSWQSWSSLWVIQPRISHGVLCISV